MRSWITQINATRAFVSLIKDPTRTDQIFDMASSLRKIRGKEVAETLAPILEREEFKMLYRERVLPEVRLEELRALPRSSFGYQVAKFFDSHGFEPNAFPLVEGEDAIAYFISRNRRVHDLWHVLADYEADVVDELALQGFTFAQLGALISPILIAGGLLHLVVKQPTRVKEAFEAIIEGYERGKAAAPLACFQIEREWSNDLEALRVQLKIPPRKSRWNQALEPLAFGA